MLEPDVVDSQLRLHGFGANPRAMLQPTARLFERQPVIAALQGPNQFFLRAGNHDVATAGSPTVVRRIRSVLHHEIVLSPHAFRGSGFLEVKIRPRCQFTALSIVNSAGREEPDGGPEA